MDSRKLCILYGSETGQSQAIAEEIYQRISEFLPFLSIYPLSDIDKKFFMERENHIVLVCSSTGDGEPPDNAAKFYRKIHRKTMAVNAFSNLRFALLGLGDTNYNSFGNCPKMIEKRLLELGAQSFYDAGYCDDAVGTDLVAEPWMEGLVELVRSKFCLTEQEKFTDNLLLTQTDPESESGSDITHVQQTPDPDQQTLASQFEESLTFGLKTTRDEDFCAALTAISKSSLKIYNTAPTYLEATFSNHSEQKKDLWKELPQFPSQASSITEASVAQRRLMTSVGAAKEKWELFLKLTESICFTPGDAFYLICPNVYNEVDWLIRRLNLQKVADCTCEINVAKDTTKRNATVPPHLISGCTLRDMLTYCLDIRRPPSKALIKCLADSASSEGDRSALSAICSIGTTHYVDFVVKNSVNILDLLSSFPTCHPGVERLLEHLPRLQPKPYSVACSPLTSHSVLRFLYSSVDIPSGNGRTFHRSGLCTTWLTKLDIGSKVKVFLKKASSFQLPPDPLQVPLILIGPGTGVAPFLGFMQHLRLLSEINNNEGEVCECIQRWLFFGCRSASTDYFCRDELEAMIKSKLLTKLEIAHSQESGPFKYVQDRLRENGPSVVQLILNNESTKVYVCGDAKGMALDVYNTFRDLFIAHGGLSPEEATTYLKKLNEKGRYLQDIWN